jgi:hypothetical protein
MYAAGICCRLVAISYKYRSYFVFSSSYLPQELTRVIPNIMLLVFPFCGAQLNLTLSILKALKTPSNISLQGQNIFNLNENPNFMHTGSQPVWV